MPDIGVKASTQLTLNEANQDREILTISSVLLIQYVREP